MGNYHATVGPPDLFAEPGAGIRLRMCYTRIQDKQGFRSLDLDQLDGTVLALNWVVEHSHHIWGSAVMVAPGVALTATHVIDEMRAKGFLGDAGGYLLALGFPKGRLEIWNAVCFTSVNDSDLSIINLVRVTSRTSPGVGAVADVHASIMAAHQPTVGEHVSVIGFAAAELKFENSSDQRPIGISLLGGVGPVSDVYADRRDNLLPNPCICVSTATAGGMSGGAAFDEKGRLVGVISRGDDQSAFVSLLWPGIFTPLEATWPAGLIPSPTNLHTMAKQQFCVIEEIERVRLLSIDGGEPLVEFSYAG